ncbi:FAD-dependent 5-carboxymethylaminomethyl-2-thiouridine(34) oxidoreductase MnmC [Variovorax terrae]|uniref:tRNA 5-methylaminomethyl-2-thiouridine biosynthesis bifunctional protein MnmC n=1 Tax=Variovorax terrae TaxID=2923278 RepID=A0A9X2AMB4_9BURK|nr:FAD-dependent 5-carboxymethylaminomethyl-2-thiouridine(34) oxidoreductase MnmC [Variovorax terrae]MCJ0763144.1 FAD-dependent 5-carboxymethylaminomethyl-2-thiouridine(34) oxidoreductase MnmC [Variovorax terrae]
MAEAVEWLADGWPRSPRFDDIYRSEAGALAQARQVFLHGCGLPQAWAGQAQWRVLETGFGLGMNFLATWLAWKTDPERPRLLHFVSVEAFPVGAADLLRSAAAHPELQPLAEALARQWQGLLPGFHRLAFEDGRVLLTLCIGEVQPMLRELAFETDAVFLDGFSPQRNPAMWEVHTLKAVARLCRRGTRMATWTVARAVRDGLEQCGFAVAKAPGLPPKRDSLSGEFNPRWEPRRPRTPEPAPMAAARCAVVGGGIAGAAVAASLARRGWQVQVLDAAARPAAGASGLPAGLLAPHVSPDDSLLSRLTRAGVRATRQQMQALLQAGFDWDASGVLEHRVDGSPGLPPAWRTPDLAAAARDWTQDATPGQRQQAGLPAADDSDDGTAPALWHGSAGWLQPARLVEAWLAQPGIRWQGKACVAQLEHDGEGWQLHDAQGGLLARADLVVLAAGPASRTLAALRPGLPALPLQAIRGQVSWAPHQPGDREALPPFPVNGHGSLIPALPLATGPVWLTGASFERDSADLQPRAADHLANLERLQALLPQAAHQLAAAFKEGRVQAWTGVRCASPDRLPLVGPLDPAHQPGLWVCTAMGSRGLTLAALCAELLAARLHGEPAALERQLAQALAAGRWIRP